MRLVKTWLALGKAGLVRVSVRVRVHVLVNGRVRVRVGVGVCVVAVVAVVGKVLQCLVVLVRGPGWLHMLVSLPEGISKGENKK